MQAVVKMPHIKIDIEGDIPDQLISVLQEEYGENIKFIEEETVNIFETKFYKDTKVRTTPGDNLKIYRQNKGLTQKQLGKLLGDIPPQHISNMERGIRNISLTMAKKLAEIFGVSVEKFVWE